MDIQPSIVKAIPIIIITVWRAALELNMQNTANNMPVPEIIRFITSEKSLFLIEYLNLKARNHPPLFVVSL